MNTPTNGSHYIQGAFIEGQGACLTSTDPVYLTTVWEGHHATEAEIIQAYESAKNALPAWSSLDAAQRAHYLIAFSNIVSKKRDELTLLIAQETGKPLWEAATEVSAVIGKTAISIDAYQKRCQETRTDSPDESACLRYKPYGVTAVLGAFNFPAHLSNGHIVPALLSGNTLLYKPSELTPAVAAFIMRCWHETGIPKGVINCLQGGAETGAHLLKLPLKGVYFTGSFATGQRIHQAFADRPDVILALEMGGNNPLILGEISNVEAAVYQTIVSAFITAGQRCTCARRLFIPDNSQGDVFLKQLIQATQTLLVGAYDAKPPVFMGSVIRHAHALAHIKKADALLAQGATALLPLALLKEKTGLLSPALFDMSKATDILDEELFAPLLQIYRYTRFEDAISGANHTRYGLAAGLLSDNKTQYELFYRHIQAGLINWNRPTTGASSRLPFGGVGSSGNHRPSAYFACDYTAYPVASLEHTQLTLPAQLLPGINTHAPL